MCNETPFYEYLLYDNPYGEEEIEYKKVLEKNQPNGRGGLNLQLENPVFMLDALSKLYKADKIKKYIFNEDCAFFSWMVSQIDTNQKIPKFHVGKATVKMKKYTEKLKEILGEDK